MTDDPKDDDPKDDDVGYGKPPKSGRFKKGRSGNPRGRPRGARNFSSVVTEQLNEKVPVKLKGKRSRKMSKWDLIIMRLVNDALNGDARARAQLFAYMPEAVRPTPEMPVEFTFNIAKANSPDEDDPTDS